MATKTTKTAAKKVAKKVVKKAAPIPKKNFRVRIRMYRQGLGDCFLLSFRKPDKKLAHVMIDCGVVLGTSEPGTVMKKVAEDIKTETGGKVDVLVITHEHWDHLSGFDAGQAREVFDKVEFETLWLAWTEDPTSSLANQLRDERERKKKATAAAKAALEKRGKKEQAKRMGGLLEFFGATGTGAAEEGEDRGGTGGALVYLKGRCDPTILKTGKEPYSIPGVEGVRVYVLGPPMEGAALKKANPRKGEGYELGGQTISLADAFLAAFDGDGEVAQPFAKSLRRPIAELESRFTEASKKASPSALPGTDGYADSAKKWRSINDAWLETGERLALQLDSATNNTSLVLAFEFEDTKEVLLFVGDAQAGNWRSWEPLNWDVKDPDGTKRHVETADLLERTIFYKVGHHGSHNATFREKGLELMTSKRLAAVIPVDTLVAHEVKDWKHMPLPGIWARLKEKCSIVFQSDTDPAPNPKKPYAGTWADSPTKFDVRMKNKDTEKVETVRKQSLYTDYFPL